MELLNRVQAMFFGRKDSGIFRQIPLHCPGKLFTSPMPFGAYDPGNRLMHVYKTHGVACVFPLITDGELQLKSRKDLLFEYEKNGLKYSRFVVADFQAPSIEMIGSLVSEAVQRLRIGERIVVHCHAGVGRTAVAAACIAMAMDGLSAEDAIAHVKANMMVNITAEQNRMVEKFAGYL